MKHRKLLIVLFCAVFALSLTACGQSGEKDGEAKEEEAEEEEEDPTIEITGEEVTSGNLSVTVPEGWEVSENDRENNWEEDSKFKLLESAYKKDSDGSVYGDVFVEINLMDSYSALENTFQEDKVKELADKYEDENGLPREYTFNDNTYLGFRDYRYTEYDDDWNYLCYTSGGTVIEIRAFTDDEAKSDDNEAAIRMILASLKFDGQAVSTNQ